MSKIAVVIPWRSVPSRVPAFEKLLKFYENSFPSFDIILSDSLGETFNISQARNLGAKKAMSNGVNLIIFNDADFFASPDAIRDAIQHSLESGEISIPYTKCFQHLNENETDLFFQNLDYGLELGLGFVWNGLFTEVKDSERWNPCSGGMIVPSEIFLNMGGFEEGIEGWGTEDIVFHKKYFKIYKRVFHYIDGSAHSTYNDPTVRVKNSNNEKYLKDLDDFS
jgi:predicted glycosyltransferase involved in capsule biosynthesis